MTDAQERIADPPAFEVFLVQGLDVDGLELPMREVDEDRSSALFELE